MFDARKGCNCAFNGLILPVIEPGEDLVYMS